MADILALLNLYGFSVKEAAIAAVTADDENSTTGVANGPKIPWRGLQKVGRNMQRDLVILECDGRPAAAESQLTELPLSLEFGKTTPKVDALLQDGAYWETPDGASFAMTDDSGGAIFSLWFRTDKTGKNGADLVIHFPKVTLGQVQQENAGKAFQTNQYSASAYYTNSKEYVYKNGVYTLSSILYRWEYRLAGAKLITATNAGAPTVTVPSANVTSFGTSAAQTLTFSEEMDPNTINEFSILWALNASPYTAVPCDVTPVGDNLSWAVKPRSALTATTAYKFTVTTTVRDAQGKNIAAEYSKTITTA